jgi:hypothetical protein
MKGLSLEDESRLQYSRILWRNPRTRRRLLYVWEHPDHPHRERFEENRPLVVGLLEHADPSAYVAALGGAWSLRTLTREIPCVIWDLWDESKAATSSAGAACR